MARASLTGDGDAALLEEVLEESSGMKRGFFDGEDEFAGRCVGGKRACEINDVGAGFR